MEIPTNLRLNEWGGAEQDERCEARGRFPGMTSLCLGFSFIVIDAVWPMTKNKTEALTGVAQLGGHRPSKQKVTDLILSQGTCLGCGFSP